MTKALNCFSILCLTIGLFACNDRSGDKLNFSKIIFHLSRCNGTCPQIDIEIDSSKNIFVNREYFKTKSEPDSSTSGQFKGVVSREDYSKLVELLQQSNIDSLQFPHSDIMDAVETTLIVYYNGQRKYLKSSTIPATAKELTAFLASLGSDKNLQRTSETKDIEN